MKQIKIVFLLLFCSITFTGCQKKEVKEIKEAKDVIEESLLETELKAMNAVFNQVVDSVYLKSKENTTITDDLKDKTIVIYDSLIFDKPGYVQFHSKFKTIKNFYVDTINETITQKIDLTKLEKKAGFTYLSKLSISKDSIKKSFWSSKNALSGVLLFSKIIFDSEKKFGAFNCIFSEGNIYTAKHFLVYIKKENENWKLDEVTKFSRMY
ncbi:hypothetical protein GOQ30_12540 [Flavobacterium sp. TP390]|uniref:Lipoprotein n=1 Tax=Flavobacterium profundi TaxID=1774945 RepID=A0A6I4ISZ8_9FLAO|nr:hypothetical protein [Flavobacterium profundi]MVO09991.1 hypothetical protein [Flavobacterium profundi]